LDENQARTKEEAARLLRKEPGRKERMNAQLLIPINQETPESKARSKTLDDSDYIIDQHEQYERRRRRKTRKRKRMTNIIGWMKSNSSNHLRL